MNNVFNNRDYGVENNARMEDKELVDVPSVASDSAQDEKVSENVEDLMKKQPECSTLEEESVPIKAQPFVRKG